ncbi:Uma2 family endonuclease [Verrucomicrobium sp. 3C]|uniref:Uma2 family endonuclease n=1 Tax=Verrucomicrobium sp. 3C TaxID=1134055 RepID=UPI00037F8A40|nr:Uma2 family endonuclease [Verrucomicrobium sp. 3C]
MPTTTFGPHTVKDWLATPEDEHWELIHGNLIMTQETAGNSGLAGEIERRIGNYLEQHPLGIVRHGIAFSFPGILAPDREGVVPDLCYIANDQLEKWDEEANVQDGVVPALVLEMLSPSTREIDWKDKVEIYREAGIGEYWIFDRHEESVRIYRFSENREKPVAIMSFEDSIPTPLLPGFSLEMPRIRQALAIGTQRSRKAR